MSLTKIINGVRQELNQLEEEKIRASWDKIHQEHQEYLRTKAYIDRRRAAYPPVEEQLDLLYKAMLLGEIPKATEWFSSIKTIKDKYPRPDNETLRTL